MFRSFGKFLGFLGYRCFWKVDVCPKRDNPHPTGASRLRTWARVCPCEYGHGRHHCRLDLVDALKAQTKRGDLILSPWRTCNFEVIFVACFPMEKPPEREWFGFLFFEVSRKQILATFQALQFKICTKSNKFGTRCLRYKSTNSSKLAPIGPIGFSHFSQEKPVSVYLCTPTDAHVCTVSYQPQSHIFYRTTAPLSKGKKPMWQPMLGRVINFAKMGLAPNRVQD